MPRWEIVGASRDSGEERTVCFDAPTERDATLVAKKRGLLISSIKEVGSPLDDLATAAQSLPSAQQETAPEYPEIVQGGKFLMTIGTVCFVAGFVSIALGAILLIFVLASFADPKQIPINVALFCTTGITAGVVALFFFVIGGAVRLFGSLSFAVRDIAQNSFRH